MFGLRFHSHKAVDSVLLVVLTVSSPEVAMAAEQNPPNQELLKHVITRVKQGDDSFTAAALLEADGEPAVVAVQYSHLLRAWYFQEKNVPAMVMFGRLGIQYALIQARRVEATDAEKAKRLRGIAKEMAYNLGVNTWPGWRDEGISITKSDLAAGLDAARLNLRLAQELKRNTEVLGNAHWLVGAHQLAQKNYPTALEEFRKSQAEFQKAKQSDFALMAGGYIALAEMLQSPAQGKPKFQAAVEALTSSGSEDAKFFAEQLRTAAEVFQAD